MKNATKNKPQRDRARDREQTCHCLSSFHNGTKPIGPAVAKEVLKGEGLHIRQTERARKLSSRAATQDDGEEIHESEKKTSSRRCDDARERNKTGVYHLPILEVSALFSAKRWSMRRTVRWLKGLSSLDSIHFSSAASIVRFWFMSALLNAVTISGSVSGGNKGRCGGGYICGGRAGPLPNGDCP